MEAHSCGNRSFAAAISSELMFGPSSGGHESAAVVANFDLIVKARYCLGGSG
jgi:hypothetical protein